MKLSSSRFLGILIATCAVLVASSAALADDSTTPMPSGEWPATIGRAEGGATLATDGTTGGQGSVDIISPWTNIGFAFGRASNGLYTGKGRALYVVDGRAPLDHMQDTINAAFGLNYDANPWLQHGGLVLGGVDATRYGRMMGYRIFEVELGAFATRTDDATQKVGGALISVHAEGEIPLANGIAIGGMVRPGVAITNQAGFVGQAQGWVSIYPMGGVGSGFYIRPQIEADVIDVRGNTGQGPTTSMVKAVGTGTGVVGITF